MKKHTIHIEAAGGNMGCTEQLSMALVDFILVIDKKRYRFDIDECGNLTILCINGVNETTDVHQGYKRAVLSNRDSDYDSYSDRKKEYELDISNAKREGCDSCKAFVNNCFYKMCSVTGEEHNGKVVGLRLSKCPFA